KAGPNQTKSFDLALQQGWPTGVSEPIYPLAVVVENQALTTPQSGLNRADVVYEALAEGGITRFLALFATQAADIVGPVRSARHYFVYWAAEYLAPLVHVGASPQGYAALSASGTSNYDEIKGAKGFWRTRDRLAPHNL